MFFGEIWTEVTFISLGFRVFWNNGQSQDKEDFSSDHMQHLDFARPGRPTTT